MKSVESMQQSVLDLLDAEFARSVELSGYYVLAEARPSSRPMRQFSGNPDAQQMISYLHRKHSLSSRARFDAHDMTQRLPWKELKQSPDSYIVFFGPNGMAAAHPGDNRYGGQDRRDQEGVPLEYRSGDTTRSYKVYYLLNDREDIFLDEYQTQRGGLANKRDARNPDNIADFIRDRLGVRGAFSAVYVSGPMVAGSGESGQSEPVTDDDLKQRTARLRRSYEPEERSKDPSADKETIDQRVNTRIRDALVDDPDLQSRVKAAVKKVKDQGFSSGREGELRLLVRQELVDQGLGWIYSGRRSMARTAPGASVERGKIQMRAAEKSTDLSKVVERVAKVVPLVLNQWRVGKIRNKQRDLINKLPDDTEQQLMSVVQSQVRSWLRQSRNFVDIDRTKISGMVKQELSYNIKDKKLIDAVVDTYVSSGTVSVPPEFSSGNTGKIQRLARDAVAAAENQYQQRQEDQLIADAADGSRNVLDNLLKSVRSDLSSKLDRLAQYGY